MNKKEYLDGNEAVARGFYEAGGLLAASYPGTPSSETIQIIKDKYKEIYAEYSENEIVAMEVVAGSSIAGARSLFNAKQLGLNVALDCLLTFTQAYINGGVVLYISDDPGLNGTQNEQDSRVLGYYANCGILLD